MRRWSNRGAAASLLGIVFAGCSSSTGSAAGVPAVGGGVPAPGAASAPAASRSGAEPGAAEPDGPADPGASAPGSAPAEEAAAAESEAREGVSTEGPGDLPLTSSEPDPEAGSDDGSDDGSEPAMAPAATDEGDPGEAPAPPATPQPPAAAQLDDVLVFTRTTGFRHPSIAPGVAALRRLAAANDFSIQQTEDPADFNDDNLARFDVVVWLNTDSEVLNEGARRAFERYIRGGGGWVGVHAASASEYDWAWYGQLLGGAAYFRGHPAIQPARVQIEIADHPSTAHLPQSYVATDEWYSFRANPRSSVRVLMTLDESSYGVGDLAMGDHPIAWYHEFDGGRAWYTALGHPNELYDDAMFTQHLLGGILWAAGAAP